MANSGRSDQALEYYYRALELNPGYIRARSASILYLFVKPFIPKQVQFGNIIHQPMGTMVLCLTGLDFFNALYSSDTRKPRNTSSMRSFFRKMTGQRTRLDRTDEALPRLCCGILLRRRACVFNGLILVRCVITEILTVSVLLLSMLFRRSRNR
jgi:hypothetical protein